MINDSIERPPADATLIPYQKPQPHDMRSDMVILNAVGHSDPRLWVPLLEPTKLRYSAGAGEIFKTAHNIQKASAASRFEELEDALLNCYSAEWICPCGVGCLATLRPAYITQK